MAIHLISLNCCEPILDVNNYRQQSAWGVLIMRLMGDDK